MNEFDDIRPFTDSEYQQEIKKVTTDPQFRGVISHLYKAPGMSDGVINLMDSLNSIDGLQSQVIVPILDQIIKSSTQGLTFSAMEQFDPTGHYLFISNHRDIILDSAFLNKIMHENKFKKTEIAIGDNLLIYPWITTLVRLNRSFIVRRNLSIREQLDASKKLSAYMRYALTEKKQSVWIAQREGRTKNGNDQTQPALLKMMNMSNSKSLVEGFKELNIVPMAISYEIEPCGILKVEELLNRKHNPDYTKSQGDDIRSMSHGVLMPKGRVHFAFGNPLNTKIDELCNGLKPNEALQAITAYIDKRIYFNYKLWPNNFIAADLLENSNRHQTNYTAAEKLEFENRMNAELASLKFDHAESMPMYLNMYAAPVFNFEKHFA
jgi:hypothetical protein